MEKAERKDIISRIRRACIKANPDLWNDHGDILKRRIAPGVAVPARLGLADVLLAVSAANSRLTLADAGDEDQASLAREQVCRIVFGWNLQKDGIDEQDDTCISTIAEVLL